MKKPAFRSGTVVLSVEQLYPMYPRKINGGTTTLYRRILTSIKEVGLIEPLVVVEKNERYFIKDGFLRWKAMQELKIDSVECLVGTDDDAYTYNKRVNPLSVAEAHTMINKAIQEGVPLERIASTLNVGREWVQQIDNLLTGITPSIVGILKQHNATKTIYEELKKVSPVRQIEIVELLKSTNDFSRRYVKTLVLSTPSDKWANQELYRAKVSEQQHKELAGKLYKVEQDFKASSNGFRDNTFNLVKLAGYLRRILNCNPARAFIDQNYPDILVSLEKIIKDPSLDV